MNHSEDSEYMEFIHIEEPLPSTGEAIIGAVVFGIIIVISMFL